MDSLVNMEYRVRSSRQYGWFETLEAIELRVRSEQLYFSLKPGKPTLVENEINLTRLSWFDDEQK